MRREDWWTKRLLQKTESNNWIDVSSKYTGRIWIALMAMIPCVGFLVGGMHTTAIVVFVASIVCIIYNAVVGSRVVNAMKEKDYDTLFGMRQERYVQEHDPDIYMFRIVRDDGFNGLKASELTEQVFFSDDLKQSKHDYLQRAKGFLNTDNLDDWQECDIGFEIWHGNFHVQLVTDPLLIPAPEVEAPDPTRV